MHTLHINEVIVPEYRQRRQFTPDSLLELQESIESIGLLQPIVVREGKTLVAGERRLRAVKEIYALEGRYKHAGVDVPPKHIPVVDIGTLSPIAAMEAELEENLRREDLTWQEKAAALARLHEMRSAAACAIGESHTVADTAQEVEGRRDGYYQEKTRQALIVADHLDNPAVAKAKDAKEAYKILVRLEEQRQNAVLSATVAATHSASAHTLLLGDCVQWMEDMEGGQFDVICTDPPYGMGADTFGDAAGRLTTITHEYSDDVDSFRALLAATARGITRVAKPAAHLYLCCDIDQFFWLREQFSKLGWSVFRTPLINVKAGGGRVPLPEHGPRRCYETILYAHRGGKRVRAIYPDVISSAADENLGHGAQKPVALYVDLLRRSALPGDRVFDPFAGTGTIFGAAQELKLIATGIELNPAYHGLCVKRLEALQLDAAIEGS